MSILAKFKHPTFRRNLALQTLLVLAVLGCLWLLAQNAVNNLERQGIARGFGFLQHKAGFALIQTLIPYSEDSTYGRAFLVGLGNTLLVATVGVILASLLGFIVGLARLSSNWLVSKLAGFYVEVLRNVPVLLQVFFWYFGVLRTLPGPRQSWQFFDRIFLNNRGLYLPKPLFFSETSLLAWDVPALSGFNFSGGLVVLPEMVALLSALSLYTAAYIAEIVRAGILAVDRGQREAAASLGLSHGQILRFVVIPQALRVIIPPLTSQYLNLTKNSSLGAAIGYPELVAVFAGTVLNQTGQAVEVILITMGVYLLLSLCISVVMNAFNRRVLARGGR